MNSLNWTPDLPKCDVCEADAINYSVARDGNSLRYQIVFACEAVYITDRRAKYGNGPETFPNGEHTPYLETDILTWTGRFDLPTCKNAVTVARRQQEAIKNLRDRVDEDDFFAE